MKKHEFQCIPHWEELYGRSGDAWLTLSRDGVIQQFNSAAAQVLGLDPAALAGIKLAALLKRTDVPTGALGVITRGMLLALARPGRPDAWVAVEELPCPVADWSGRLLRLTDVTEVLELDSNRVRKLDRLAALADIMTLAESDRQHWLEQSMELGARALGLEFGVVGVVEDRQYRILAHNAPGLLQQGQVFPLEHTYCSLTVQQQDVLALSSFLQSVYADRPCFKYFAYHSYIGIPLWVNGALYGTVSFASKVLRPVPFDYNDKIFVKLLARWVGGMVERMMVEHRLRESHSELEEQVELLAMAENVARLGHWRLDPRLRTVLLSEEAQRFLGLPTRAEWGLGEFEALIAADDRGTWHDQFNTCIEDGTSMELELRMTSVDGYRRWLSLRGMRLEQGEQAMLFGVMLDITDNKQAQETILYQASHDALTGLINRVLLFDRLGQEIRRCQRSDNGFAVLFIDLDFFKAINDHYGHEAGDRVLVQVAKRLTAVLRKSDTVGRFGGDEFIAIIPGMLDRAMLAQLAKKILRKLEQPVVFGKEQLRISASIGAAFYPGDATLPHELIRIADNDMYCVKEQRRHLPPPSRAAAKAAPKA